MTIMNKGDILFTRRTSSRFWKLTDIYFDKSVVMTQNLKTKEILENHINNQRTIIIDNDTIEVNLDTDERIIKSSKLSKLLYE